MDKPASEQKIIHELSERLVTAQAPIRILDAIKWDNQIKTDFLKNNAKKLPNITQDYYQHHTFSYDLDDKRQEFNGIIRDARNLLGQYSVITQLIEQRCLGYLKAIDLLDARGTEQFADISKELYGGPNDAFYLNGPKLSELGSLLGNILEASLAENEDPKNEKIYSAAEAQQRLQHQLNQYFDASDTVVVEVSDDIIADAAAGADTIKLNSDVKFSERDLRYLEVHEGWVHLGTTLNGRRQPCCTFLAKGAPASAVTQEGLAVITEVFTFSSYPDRLLRLANRVRAIEMAENGANFIEVYHFFLEQGFQADDAYNYTTRVFRGSTPEGKPFTKDLSYTRGFVLIYNYIRLSVQRGAIANIPLLFCGKVLIEEVQILSQLVEQDIVNLPTYLPPQFKDLNALMSWMSLSLFLNKFDLGELEKYFSL